MSFKECYLALKALRVQYGTSNFDQAIRQLMRERVNPDRDARDKTSPAEKQKMFNTQKGMCPVCNKLLFIPATDRRNEVDHIDPNRPDFNHRSNKQLVHGDPCNRKKSSKSILQQSKESGQAFTQIIRTQVEEDV